MVTRPVTAQGMRASHNVPLEGDAAPEPTSAAVASCGAGALVVDVQAEPGWAPTPLSPLREVADSLRQAALGMTPAGRTRGRLRGRVEAAGGAVLPTLLRALRSDHAVVVDWACDLLGYVSEPHRPRLFAGVNALLVDPAVHDGTKARLLGLLSDLKAPIPAHVTLRDPDAMIRNSVHDLLSDLTGEDAVAQALDLLFSQVPAEDLPRFLDEVLRHGHDAATPLFQAIIADGRTPRELADRLAGLVRPTQTASVKAGRSGDGGLRSVGRVELSVICDKALGEGEAVERAPRDLPGAMRACRALLSGATSLAQRTGRQPAAQRSFHQMRIDLQLRQPRSRLSVRPPSWA